jgi:hypothetical protein
MERLYTVPKKDQYVRTDRGQVIKSDGPILLSPQTLPIYIINSVIYI